MPGDGQEQREIQPSSPRGRSASSTNRTSSANINQVETHVMVTSPSDAKDGLEKTCSESQLSSSSITETTTTTTTHRHRRRHQSSEEKTENEPSLDPKSSSRQESPPRDKSLRSKRGISPDSGDAEREERKKMERQTLKEAGHAGYGNESPNPVQESGVSLKPNLGESVKVGDSPRGGGQKLVTFSFNPFYYFVLFLFLCFCVFVFLCSCVLVFCVLCFLSEKQILISCHSPGYRGVAEHHKSRCRRGRRASDAADTPL